MVIDAEIVSIFRRFLEGITVNDETLAVDVVAEVGPRGNFLESPHTMEQIRAGALWEESISNRFGYETWKAHGGADIVSRAAEKAESILASHEPEPLPQNAQGAMIKVIEEFEATH